MVDLFAGIGGVSQGTAVLTVILIALITLFRCLPAIIWAVRCRPDSRQYRCPSLPGRRSSVSGFVRRLHDRRD